MSAGLKPFAVLFDWDGVIIDSSSQHERAWEFLAAERHFVLPSDHFRRGFGKRNETIIPELGWASEPAAGGKPDPEVFLRGAKGLGFSPAHCVVIEDALVGLEAARNAGMACLGVATTRSRPLLAVFAGIKSSNNTCFG